MLWTLLYHQQKMLPIQLLLSKIVCDYSLFFFLNVYEC